MTAVLYPFLIPPCAFAGTIPYELGIKKVRELIARKQYDNAEHFLSVMLREYPDNPELLSIRGRVRLWNGEIEAAEADLRRSLRRREDRTVRADLAKAEIAKEFALAESYLAKGNGVEAEKLLKDLFDAHHDRYNAGLLLGRLYTNSGDYSKARDLYRMLNEEFPLEYEITLLYVRSLILTGDTERAEQVVALLPDESNPSLYLARAAITKMRGEYAESLEGYRRALQLHEDPSVRKEMDAVKTLLALREADAALAAGNPGLAKIRLRPLYEEGVNRYDAGHRLARIAVQLKELDEALAIYRSLAEEYPGDNDTILAYIDTLLMGGRTEEARALLATLPVDESPALRLRRARTLYHSGRFDEAIEDYRNARKGLSDPVIADEIAMVERAEALQRADRLAREGKVGESEQILSELYTSGKERYESGVRLARSLQGRREFGRAAAILGDLCNAYPSDDDLRLAYLDVLLASGDLQAAERVLSARTDDRSQQLSLRRGRLMFRLRRYEEAVQALRSAGDALEPTVRQEREAAENALALEKALLLMRAGKLDEATALWNELFNSGRERYESGYQLGMSYLARREFVRAREHFTGLSAEFPKDPGIYALAAESQLLSGDVEKAAVMVREASPEQADYIRREREDLIYRVRPNYMKISGLVAGYDNGIHTGREMALTVSQRIAPATLVANAATMHRYGMDDSEFGVEITSPVSSSPALYGTGGFSYSPDARFLPRTTMRGEVTCSAKGLEYSLGYTRMNFRNDSVNIMVLGGLGYPTPTLSINERLYIVPESGTFSVLSTINYEPNHRLRGFYSLGLGTASEQVGDRQAFLRYFTVTNRLGMEYRPVPAVSGGGEFFEEFRNGLYNRYGSQFFVKYWW